MCVCNTKKTHTVLQCVPVCCSVLHCVAVCCSFFHFVSAVALSDGGQQLLPSFPQVCVFAACCSVLHCVAARCSVLQYVALCFYCGPLCWWRTASAVTSAGVRVWCVVVEVCCSVLQCVEVCCSVLLLWLSLTVADRFCHYTCRCECIATCCNVLQRVTLCCNVLHCVAVCCIVLPCVLAVCVTNIYCCYFRKYVYVHYSVL